MQLTYLFPMNSKIKINFKVDAIFVSDIHLRLDNPPCRLDNIVPVQWKCLDFISNLQKKYDCDVYCAGDLYHYWKPSPELISETIKHIPNRFYTIYGQHDLPQHSMELKHKSGIYTLQTAGKLKVLKGVHWEQKVKEKYAIDIKGRKLLVWHILNYRSKKPYPNSTDPMAMRLLINHPEFDVILTGDNHRAFTESRGKQLLLNPGSMTRQKADQISHKPCIFLYNAKSNSVKKVYLPDNEDVISRDHIKDTRESDKYISEIISKMDTEFKITLNFEDNVMTYLKKNKTNKNVKRIILKAID